MSKDDGGPAFPRAPHTGDISDDGMSMRDYFAAACLPVAWAIVKHGCDDGSFAGTGAGANELIACEAYILADRMLAERSKP